MRLIITIIKNYFSFVQKKTIYPGVRYANKKLKIKSSNVPLVKLKTSERACKDVVAYLTPSSRDQIKLCS